MIKTGAGIASGQGGQGSFRCGNRSRNLGQRTCLVDLGDFGTVEGTIVDGEVFYGAIEVVPGPARVAVRATFTRGTNEQVGCVAAPADRQLGIIVDLFTIEIEMRTVFTKTEGDIVALACLDGDLSAVEIGGPAFILNADVEFAITDIGLDLTVTVTPLVFGEQCLAATAVGIVCGEPKSNSAVGQVQCSRTFHFFMTGGLLPGGATVNGDGIQAENNVLCQCLGVNLNGFAFQGAGGQVFLKQLIEPFHDGFNTLIASAIFVEITVITNTEAHVVDAIGHGVDGILAEQAGDGTIVLCQVETGLFVTLIIAVQRDPCLCMVVADVGADVAHLG